MGSTAGAHVTKLYALWDNGKERGLDKLKIGKRLIGRLAKSDVKQLAIDMNEAGTELTAMWVMRTDERWQPGYCPRCGRERD